MSDNIAHLRHKIDSAEDLQSVVRTMKAMAASNINQYEQSVLAVAEYYRTIELGLVACLRGTNSMLFSTREAKQNKPAVIGAIIFGSDQGLVGKFNELIADHAIKNLTSRARKPNIWVVGERVQEYLTDTGLPVKECLAVPNSINAITPLISKLLAEIDLIQQGDEITELHLFYNQTKSGGVYVPVALQLLPLDEEWQRKLLNTTWPSKKLPEIVGDRHTTLQALIREYFFVSIFRACAESMASENASRLAAMQRANKNIDELLDDLNKTFHHLRQSNIDDELSDVISGFEALGKIKKQQPARL